MRMRLAALAAVLAFWACSELPTYPAAETVSVPTTSVLQKRSAYVMRPFLPVESDDQSEVELSARSAVGMAAAASVSTTCVFEDDVDEKKWTLLADCTTDGTILIPNGYTLDGKKHTITAVDPSGGHFLGAVILNAGATAEVKNLTIIGSEITGSGSTGPPDTRLRGILFNGASGKIEKNTVIGMNRGSGSQEGNGIEIRNAPFDGTHPNTVRVEIKNNIVTGYQKNGITANGDVYADIFKNTVTGLGPVPNIAQNGIQFGCGATGKATHNTVAGSWYTGAGWTASGILVFEANGVKVEHNTVTGSQSGLVAESWCWYASSADDNKFSHNTVKDADYGITIDAVGWSPPYSTCAASASNNEVDHNEVTGMNNPGSEGIFVVSFYVTGESSPVVDGNNMSETEIDGHGIDAVEITSGDGTAETASTWENNKCTTSDPDGLCRAETDDDDEG